MGAVSVRNWKNRACTTILIFTPDYPVDSPEYAQDVSYVFQHLDANDPGMSKSDLTISETLSDYWVNFVKFGEPNGGSLPQWAPFTNNTLMVMYFANTPHLGSVPDEAQLEVLDRYFKWKLGL